MLDGLYGLVIIDLPTILVFSALSIVAVLYLLIRRPTARWIVTVLIAILGAALIAVVLILVLNASETFGPPLPPTADIWTIITFAAIGLAIVNLWRSRWWRKVIAAISIVLFALTGGLIINAYFGLDRTVGSLFGIVSGDKANVIGPNSNDADPTTPLYETWKPPADMPVKGKTGLLSGTDAIPATLSGFPARAASVYYPPAALVKNPPRLPFVLLMMGQPGTPDPQYIANVLDGMAAKNHGLAPIALVVDQLSDPTKDPACADSTTYGKAETYITKDVVNWAKANLNILHSAKYWTIAGYSNGGACAFKYAAQSPDVWGNLIDASGDEFPGTEIQADTIKNVFGGNKAAYEASKPASILAAHPGAYSKTVAVFTTGQNDAAFGPGAKRASQAAQAAGMQTTFYVIPGADHVGGAVDGGLQKGFDVLYPHLGLSKPT